MRADSVAVVLLADATRSSAGIYLAFSPRELLHSVSNDKVYLISGGYIVDGQTNTVRKGTPQATSPKGAQPSNECIPVSFMLARDLIQRLTISGDMIRIFYSDMIRKTSHRSFDVDCSRPSSTDEFRISIDHNNRERGSPVTRSRWHRVNSHVLNLIHIMSPLSAPTLTRAQPASGGNIMQWVDLTTSASAYTGTAITASWFETTSGSLTNVNIKTPYTNANGVGAIYINSATDNCGFMRGHAWHYGEAGAFGLYLGLPGTNTNHDIGFRCARP